MSNLNAARPAHPRSRGRRWAFRIGGVVLSWALLEVLSAVVWWSELPGATLEEVTTRREDVVQHARPQAHPTEAIHPYVGWVLNPDLHPAQEAAGRRFPVNNFGYVDDGATRYKRSTDRLLVGIVGGSVAQHISLIGDQVLRDQLEAAPGIAPRKVQFVRLALSGHKQPQQLMSVAYLLAQGGELDVLINIDGYNEAVLTMTENQPHGVALAYPRSWHHRLADVVDPRIDSESFELLRLRVRRRRAARLADSSPFRHSPTCCLAWLAYDRWVDRSLAELGSVIRDHKIAEGHGFAGDGPKEHFAAVSDAEAAACEIWKQGSRQLSRLCSANGIRYVHILQPNQYLDGSKPLSDHEREFCYAPDERFALFVRNIYPRMQKAGEALTEEGIAFHDATSLFKDHTETLYSDYFCHYNKEGNDLLAAAVARWVVENFGENSKPAD